MAQSKEAAADRLATIGEETKKVGVSSAAEQQSDNVAHALAGAGGGLLSMALTYDVHLSPRLISLSAQKTLTVDAFSSATATP